jgi:hypothetical protein
MKRFLLMACAAIVACFLSACGASQGQVNPKDERVEQTVEITAPAITPTVAPTEAEVEIAERPAPVNNPDADGGKITVDDIGVYEEAPEVVYRTTAEENGLGDKLMYADGSIKRFFTESGYSAFEFVSKHGSIAILDVVTDAGWSDLAVCDGVRVYFSYMGYSSVLDMAAGCYYGVIPLDAELDEIPDSIALGYLASGGDVS